MEEELRVHGGQSLDEVIEMLQAAKERGEHVYCVFNGHELHSDTISVDSAYKEVTGHNKEESDRIKKEGTESYERRKQEERDRDALFEKMVADSRTGKVEITKEKVIDGLKFIAENQDLDQVEFVAGLIDLGCNFTLDEVNEQLLPEEIMLIDGMREGNLGCAAGVIANMRDNDFGRNYGTRLFLENDSDQSIYHVVRLLTGDDTYTKENLNSKGRNK